MLQAEAERKQREAEEQERKRKEEEARKKVGARASVGGVWWLMLAQAFGVSVPGCIGHSKLGAAEWQCGYGILCAWAGIASAFVQRAGMREGLTHWPVSRLRPGARACGSIVVAPRPRGFSRG